MKLRVLLTAGIAVAGSLTAVPHAANAAPLLCLESDAGIYTAPASVTGNAGDLISCRSVTLTEVPGKIPMNAWKVKYTSTDLNGKKIAVSGTVAVPKAAWTKGGSRPTVAFNPGTLGSGPQCAFSKQIAGEYQDEYEGDQLAAFLKAGFAVAATDGVGYLDGQTHTYMIGHNAGHALLDIVRAARQIPFGSLKSDGKVAISGYSEGGGASLWGAQLAASYAPELKVVGAAAGGVPGDLKVTAAKLNGGPFAGFLVDAVLGLHAAYPTLPFDSLLNAKGAQAVKDGGSLCVAGTLAAFVGADIKNYSTAGYTLDQLYTLKDASGQTWGDAVGAQKLGVGIGGPASSAKYKIGFPTYQYRGALEEIIPTETEDATRQAYCDAGIRTQWNKSYPGDHILADGQAIKDVTAWIGDRFTDQPAPSNC
jgi:hypothetical protein